ncbi:multiple epidermal growth factor-like domains protein 10 [Saccostrea cucullata]|uniref:multiple epidermal growth factor-like domains protein 10 n=1 Tax=Saccostrea cuccullata TaxID=36930 RepID=UPI002ED3B4AE
MKKKTRYLWEMMVRLSYIENLARFVLIFNLTLIQLYLFIESPQRKHTSVYAAIIKDCNPGFTGRYCELPCSYPGFGKGCQETCNCVKEYCDEENGCKDGSQTFSSTTIKGTTKLHFTRNILICQNGFIGMKCENKCRYPSYGSNCQLECLCIEDLCNHVSGCHTNDESIGKNTVHTTSGFIGFTKSDSVLTTERNHQSKNRNAISETKKTTSKRFSSILLQSILVLGILASFLFILYVCTFVMSSYGRFRAHQEREFIFEINHDPI